MNAPLPDSPLPDGGDRAKHGLPFREFVAMMAALIAVNALGIDIMLPALGLIGRDLGVAVENHQQLVIVTYTVGYGVGQLFWGPLADRYGRRSVLLVAMVVYMLMSVVAALAGSFEMLLVARMLQGISSASTRTLSISIIRDCYSGRRMAKVSSLVFMTFLAVPIIAPTLGQAVLLVAPWHWIFYALGAYSLLVALWAWRRLPETLDPADRMPINPRALGAAARLLVTNRVSIGYTVAGGVLYGGLLAFLNSAQQILLHVFHRPDLFTLCFAAIASFMVMATLINASFVERFGMRMISHIAVVTLIILCLIHLTVQLAGYETLLLFTLFNGMGFFCFGLASSNFSAMAMDPMAHIAGTASSIQGFLSTLIGSLVGFAIGQAFHGTTLPLTLGWEINALVALAIILWTEHGRLFHGHYASARA